MIFRLTKKLATKIKVGNRSEMPLDQNPFADWSARAFAANRRQHILLTNTQALYSCILLGKGITNAAKFVDAAVQAIERYMHEDELGELFEEHILPSSQTLNFGKTLSRSTTASINSIAIIAKSKLEQNLDLNESSRRLNQFPIATLLNKEGQGFNSPDKAIKLLLPSTESD